MIVLNEPCTTYVHVAHAFDIVCPPAVVQQVVCPGWGS